jgi:hypothetical protein
LKSAKNGATAAGIVFEKCSENDYVNIEPYFGKFRLILKKMFLPNYKFSPNVALPHF